MHRGGSVLAGVVLLAATACSSAGSDDGTWQRPSCDRAPAPPPETTTIEGSESDLDVTSFDGTTIRAHWFPLESATADEPAPTVLMGPGWSLPGDSDPDVVGVFGALNISTLRDAGFNVLTWDPRGFGESGGLSTVNGADVEGRDVSRLLDWVAAQPEALLDAEGDPRSGMIGGSYGGGIQLVTAADDCRVDALVPIVAWHSLETSLFKAETPKLGWAQNLVTFAGPDSVDPHVTSASSAAAESGVISDEDVAWFVERGPGDAVGRITAPTLLVHGTVDTLFTLDEAESNYEALRDAGVPVGMVWFCGGHGTCLTSPPDAERIERSAIAWLRRYVADDATVELGPAIELIDQNGDTYRADDYPLAAGEPLVATGSGQLALVAEGGAGPAEAPEGGDPDLLAPLVLPITPTRATNAVDVTIATPSEPVLAIGAPRLELTYSGTVADGERPTRVFAQLVDEATGLVLGNQITPIEVVLDGETHTTSVPLEVVSFATTPGSDLTLQLVATTVAYAQPRLDGTVSFAEIAVELPVAAEVSPPR